MRQLRLGQSKCFGILAAMAFSLLWATSVTPKTMIQTNNDHPPGNGSSQPPHSVGIGVNAEIVVEGSNVPYTIDGVGAITSNPIGINCSQGGQNCSASFELRLTPIILFATPLSRNWVFDRWSGDCSGTNQSFALPLRPSSWEEGFSCAAHFKALPGLSFSDQILSTDYVNPSPAPINTSDPTWARNICGGKTWGNFPPYIGPRYEWTPVFSNEFDSNLVAISGTALRPKLSDEDVWFTHPFGFDWEFFVAPDSQYTPLLAPSNTLQHAQDPNAEKYLRPDGEYTSAIQQAQEELGLRNVDGVLGVEIDQGLIPDLYRVHKGDRVAVFGRWIADCGHDDFHSEIHPPLVISSASGSAGGEATHSITISRPYLVSQEFDTGPLPRHMLNEIVKAMGIASYMPEAGVLGTLGATSFCPALLIPFPPIPWPPYLPCTTRIEAHPKIMPKPFSGIQGIKYLVRPPSPRSDPGDKLIVQYHFTVRSGVVVFLFAPHDPPDAVAVFILMNDSLYNAPPLTRGNNGLGANFGGAAEGPDCSISQVVLAGSAEDEAKTISLLTQGLILVL
jgi:hypothetical protein